MDGETPGIEVLRLAGTSYEPHGYFEEADTLTSPALPGFSFPIAEILK